MAIMELKLAQEIANIYQDPLFLVFLELQKSYYNVDRYRLLITLEGYGSGPQMCGILGDFLGLPAGGTKSERLPWDSIT